MNTDELFEVDLSKYAYIELADWIISCRQNIPTPDGLHSEEYINQVFSFCEKWEAHFKQNQDIYKSIEYQKALLHIGRRAKFKFVVDFAEGKEDITQSVMENMQVRFVERKKIVESTFDEDVKKARASLLSCFRKKKEFRDELRKVVRDTLSEREITKIRVFKDYRWLKASSFEELIKRCEELDSYTTEYEKRTSYTSYMKILEDFGVPKTIYSDYMNEQNEEKAFDKKFFINLSLALSLPCDDAEELLRINGFSIKESIKVFDKICEKGLRIGFGRDYIIALIEKYNADMKKKPDKYVEVQNITKTKKVKKAER